MSLYLVDLRLHFQTLLTAIHVDRENRNTTGHSPFYREHLRLFEQNYLRERETEGERSQEMLKLEVFMPGKIVPHKWCLPTLNISLKKDFDTGVLFN